MFQKSFIEYATIQWGDGLLVKVKYVFVQRLKIAIGKLKLTGLVNVILLTRIFYWVSDGIIEQRTHTFRYPTSLSTSSQTFCIINFIIIIIIIESDNQPTKQSIMMAFN